MIFHYPLIKVIEMTYSARGYKKNTRKRPPLLPCTLEHFAEVRLLRSSRDPNGEQTTPGGGTSRGIKQNENDPQLKTASRFIL